MIAARASLLACFVGTSLFPLYAHAKRANESDLLTPSPSAEAEAPFAGVAAVGSVESPAPPVGSAESPESPELPGPWRLSERLDLPDWLEISGEQRTRYETLDEQFRAGQSGNFKMLALRTLLMATARTDSVRFTAEMIDSRQYGARDSAPLGTDLVNPVELLQGFLGIEFEDVLADGDALDLQIGRMTLDIGTRRLVARNDFRNTINAFTGVNALWESERGETLQAFYVLPVQRLPNDQQSLLDNDIQFDEEREQVQFFGLRATTPNLGERLEAEAYLYGLDEEDGIEDLQTSNRELLTVGGRVARRPQAEEFDFEWESAYQFGESRSSSNPSNTTDLDHEAHFHHLSLGYQFDADWKLRIEALFDYASGDDDPTDGDNGRFDTLFGARRFEFGPTGIFGAFARSNLISPGLRLFLRPTDDTEIMLAHRFHFLASDQDAWTTSGLVDPTGEAGREIGQLAEVRFRHDVLPKNLRFETGVAHFFAGDFVDDAPNASGQGDTTYFYLMTTLWF